MFKWKKLGQVFNPTKVGKFDWMQEQAQNPYPVDMGNFVRVYFNCRSKRDTQGKSRSFAGYVDLKKGNFFEILEISAQPLLMHGSKGSFDEFGIMEGAVTQINNEYYLYYVGWTRMLSVPYNWSIGLAKSSDGKIFTKFGNGPIIGSTHKEPFLQAGCSAIIKLNGEYHLWYTSGIKWIETDSKPESVYQIMHATSGDGINWKRNGIPVIKEVVENEAQASPSIIEINGRWHMFFSYRHSVDFRNKERGYRLGYAWSDNLLDWQRDDSKVGLQVSESGWDSEMVCYPSVIRIENEIYLFYCGNDFGREGFGIAQLVK
jgi:predicted GH43/DUF377 family glycosyl hydrolase